MKQDYVKIDTVPLPEKDMSFTIPRDLLKDFDKDIRIVIRHPWIIGIPIPETLLNKDKIRNYRDFDAMLIPRR